MYKITNVSFVEYYSNNVSKDVIYSYLMNSTCSNKGTIKLNLESGKRLKQEGPYILPPIRWLDSFEKNAEFTILCEVDDIK
jgi:hypothetical protein